MGKWNKSSLNGFSYFFIFSYIVLLQFLDLLEMLPIFLFSFIPSSCTSVPQAGFETKTTVSQHYKIRARFSPCGQLLNGVSEKYIASIFRDKKPCKQAANRIYFPCSAYAQSLEADAVYSLKSR